MTDLPTPARILVIFGSIPFLGQERGNIQALQTLSEAGHEVLFVTNDTYGHERIQPALDERGLAWTTGAYPGFFSPRMSLREWVTQTKTWVRGNLDFIRAARDFEPTHIHVGNERFLLNFLPAVWWLRRPVIFRVGDKPRNHHPFFRRIWRSLLVPTVSRFVPISEFVASQLHKLGAAESKVRVIYSYPPERAEPQTHLELEPFGGTTVTYVGQISDEKGVGLLIEAALQLCFERDDVRFYFAGDYSWENPFAEGLIREVEASGLGDRIRFLGYVEDVPGLLSASDLHVCPSVCEEALGNVVLEAKRAGVPSVVFPSGGLPELIEPGRDGFVCSASTAEALTRQLAEVLETAPKAVREMGKEAGASLERLGITKEAFKRAWNEVYASV